jgi:putative transposase
VRSGYRRGRIGRIEQGVDACNQLVAQRHAPMWMFVDNDSEFSGRLLDPWAYHHCVQIDFSRPGKLTDNCVIETFTGSLRDECLNVHWFALLEEAKEKLEGWRRDSKPQKANAGFGPGNPSTSPTRGLSL